MAAGRLPSRESDPESSSGDSLSELPEDERSVTDVGEPVLVRASAIEISRGSILAARYQVETVLGRGGSGIVLRAFDRVTQVAVAIKILRPDLAADPRWIERFSRELRLARQLQHANVCRVFDIGQADGHWFITMELASGGTLRDHFGEVGRQRSFGQKLEDARAVVAGLAAIHAAGIVHRDVKPDNFLRMADDRLVLSDFGLATNPSDGSMVSVMVGTPAYMAPEVVLGDQSSFRSDVWSLGVVLHELIFGARPERSGQGVRIASEHPPRGLTSPERAAFWFIQECLQDDPLSRPADGKAAQARFEKVLSAKGGLRSPSRQRTTWAWPALAIAALIGLGAGTNRWWSGALAGSSRASHAPVTISGEATDWTNISSVVATFEDPVHCISWLDPDRSLEVVLGLQRRAVTVDVTTHDVKPSSLGAEAFALGCPQRSVRGEVLFESFDQTGRRQILLAPSADRTREAKAITPGFQPVWFPSGHEFAYTADDSHAAVFSLPVMTTTIVNEHPEDSGLLTGKAVAPDGRSMALRYVDQSMRWHVVVHELPTLAKMNSAVFDEVATDFEYLDDKSNDLAFSLSGKAGAVFAIHDPLTNEVARVGAIPGHILALPTRGRRSFAVSDILTQSDVWRLEAGVRTERLTMDGQSSRPDVSPKGDLIVEHLGIDERASIQLRVKGEAPRLVSAGPRDYTPHFLPDGNGWLYVDGVRQTIRRCDMSANCRDVYTASDNEMPFQPVASPDLRQVAFVTAIGRERLKILGSDGTVRDLAPARADCAPQWGPGNHVWVLQGGEQKPAWTEIDVGTGEVLRTLPISADVRQESRDCPPLSSPPEVFRPREAASWSSARSSVRVVSHQHLGLGQRP